jgi:hypothetical protein
MSRSSQAVPRTGELERLAAVETLKQLSKPEDVKLADLVAFLEQRGLWAQFAKITLGDLRDLWRQRQRGVDGDGAAIRRAVKARAGILKQTFDTGEGEAPSETDAARGPARDGGLDTEQVARMVLPFIEGNGDVTVEDMAEYTRLDKRVLRHHLAVLCREGRLERLGVGRHAVYSTTG